MAGTALFDINLLLALSWNSHPHHAASHRWFSALTGPWATCPLTELGYVRLSSNPRVIAAAGTPALAVQGLVQLRALRPQFWPNDYSPADETAFARLQGHNQVTDAYLLLLAHRHKGKLATFDAGIKALARELLGDDKRVLLIPH